MRQNSAIFVMPRKSDVVAVEAHKSAVFQTFGDVFDKIDDALRSALPKVKSMFLLHEGPVDLFVHAPWTRYLVRLELLKKSESVFDEDDIEFNMLRVSNCGLCVRTSHGDIRVLKNPNDGLPKALSDARVRFVTNNQLAFAFAENEVLKLRSLNLFVLWKMSSDYEYLGMEIVCPKDIREKGDIECYWMAPWRKADSVKIPMPQVPVALDLDEIVAIPARDEKKIAE